MTYEPIDRKSLWPVQITSALGIPPVQGREGPWHSSGGTTDASWFLAMCDYLGIDYPGERILAMRVILERVGVEWDEERHSSAGPGKFAGGNVRKQAFSDLWGGLRSAGVITRDGRPSEAGDALLHGGGGPLPDGRWVYRHIRMRQGQAGFRARLVDAYDGRCAVSDCDLTEVLEAAHITPHSQGGLMATSNGILLRADLHTLFDLRLLAINTVTWTVLLHSRVRETDMGLRLHGRPFRRPQAVNDHPSAVALDRHRGASGIAD